MPRDYTDVRTYVGQRTYIANRLGMRSMSDYAYKINSTNKIAILNSTSFSPTNSSGWTFAILINLLQRTSATANIFAQLDGSGSNGRIWATLRSDMTLSTFIDGSFHDSNVKLSLGHWRYLFFTYSGGASGDFTFYVADFSDCSFVNVGTVNPGVVSEDGTFRIGQSKAGGGQLGRCLIKHAALYDSQLSDSALQNLFYCGDYPSNSIFDLRFSEGSGTAINDSSANNNDGTATAANWNIENFLLSRSYV